MKCLYFVSKWPKHNYSSADERFFSLVGSMRRYEYDIEVMCKDEAYREETKDIRQYPVELVECKNYKIPKFNQAKFAIFDNYLTANAYSSQIYNKVNSVIQVLHLQQLQSLRRHRQKIAMSLNNTDRLVEAGQKMWDFQWLPEQKKAISRADMVLTCSDFHYFNLKKEFPELNQFQASQLLPVEQYKQQCTDKQYRPFVMRKNFFFIGNMKNEENIDMVKVLVEDIWPMVRKSQPTIQLHLYGSQFPEELWKAKSHLKEQGVKLMGEMEQLDQIGKYFGLVAPARFSGSLKGKILDCWFEHTPVITTPIGAEGLFLECSDESLFMDKTVFHNEKAKYDAQESANESRIQAYYNDNKFTQKQHSLKFGGLFNSLTKSQFVQHILEISSNEKVWDDCRRMGSTILLKNHSDHIGEKNLIRGLNSTEMHFKLLRQRDDFKKAWARTSRGRVAT